MRPLLVPILLALLVPLLLPAPAQAQYGIKGGINLVDFFGEDVQGADRRPRLAGGASFELLSLGPLTLAPELYYAQKGAEQFQTRLTEEEAAEISLTYAEVPVLLRVALPFGGRWFRPYLAGGPVFGWRLDCKVAAGPDGTQPECDQLLGGEEQLEATLREYEQGLMFGAGVAVTLFRGIGAITLDGRYAQGLTRLSNAEDAPEIQNRALAVLLGYRFGLGR